MLEFLRQYTNQIHTFELLLMMVNALIHVFFAGSVARDAGQIHRNGKLALVGPATWAFATLLGGVITAAIYWFIHHSTLTIPSALGAKSLKKTV